MLITKWYAKEGDKCIKLIESALMMAKYYYLNPAALSKLKVNLLSMILITLESQHKAFFNAFKYQQFFIIITFLKCHES